MYHCLSLYSDIQNVTITNCKNWILLDNGTSTEVICTDEVKEITKFDVKIKDGGQLFICEIEVYSGSIKIMFFFFFFS